MDKLFEQDRQLLLRTLHEHGPQTVQNLAKAMRLSVHRISSMLRKLEEQGLVQVPRCTTGSKGTPINVWEALTEKPS